MEEIEGGGKMTEEEANRKWCPMVRQNGENATFNRGGQKDDAINALGMATGYGCNCIASGCMMWRWDRNSCVDKAGYCGLGGKP